MRYFQYIGKFFDRLEESGATRNPVIKIFYLLHFLWCHMVHGCSVNDYFIYDFRKKSNIERREFVTWRRHSKIQKMFNRDGDTTVFSNKLKFNSVFRPYLGREYLDLSSCSDAGLASFLEGKEAVFVKDIYGALGQGVIKMAVNENTVNDIRGGGGRVTG